MPNRARNNDDSKIKNLDEYVSFRGNRNIYENIRIFFLTLIACMYGKHAFSHGKYDYLILSGLYIIYAALLHGSVGFKNQFELIVFTIAR